MLKKFSSFIVIVIFWSLPAWGQEAGLSELKLKPQDRILILAPHPDDEVLCCTGVMQQAKDMGIPVKVVFLTMGDSNQWSFMLYRKHPVLMPRAVQKMGMVRRDEALRAAAILGLDPDDLVFLGYPDFGTMNIWYSHWNERASFKGILTRVNKVPYPGTYREGADHKGEDILKDVRSLIKEFQPTKIFCSHPADHNSDHLSMYLFTRVALWDEQLDNVELLPYLIHYKGWPKPSGLWPDQILSPPENLQKAIPWYSFPITKEQGALKLKALEAHKTQYIASRKYLQSFVRTNELFGDFPTIRLNKDAQESVFKTGRNYIASAELPDEADDQVKKSFVGVEWKFVHLHGDYLEVSIALSKSLAKDVEASLYIFGYRQDTPFNVMPKISVRLGVMSYSVYEQSRRIKQNSVKVERTRDEITIKVPLELLGHPQRVLTSTRTYLGNIPLDTGAWMAVEFL